MQGGWSIRETANGRNTFRCDVVSEDGTYRPSIDHVLTVVEGAVTYFGGIITSPAEEGVLGEPGIPIVTRITAVDFSILAQRRYVNETIPAGTLKAALVVLTTYLASYGVTLDAGQVDGPTLPELVYEDKRLDEVLNELTVISNGYIWTISYTKVLSMALPASTVAPFNVSDANGHAIGDILVEPNREDFANYIIVRAGSGTHDVEDVFTGDGVEDSFQLSTPLVNHYGIVTNAGVVETLSLQGIGFDLAAFWLYYAVDNTIRRVPAAGPPANGNEIRVSYIGLFPIRVTADGGAAAADRVEKVVTEPDVFNRTVAQALADSYLPRFMTGYKTVRYKTFQQGAHPGQSQTIVTARRNYNALSLITDVDIQHLEGSLITYSIRAQEGTLYQGSWRDTIKRWGGGSISSGGVGGAALTLVSGGRPSYFLGGNATLLVQSTDPTWIPVDAVQITIDTVVRGTTLATVTARLRATAGSVTARLQNITDNTTAGTSSAVSDTSWVTVTFPAVLAVGVKTYELQVLPSLADTDVAAVGYLE